MTKTPTGKNPKGTVAVENVNGRVRLRWRDERGQRHISLGLPYTKENERYAQTIANRIENDRKYGYYDPGCIPVLQVSI